MCSFIKLLFIYFSDGADRKEDIEKSRVRLGICFSFSGLLFLGLVQQCFASPLLCV